MTLPPSGTISFADINVELKRSSTATLDMNSAVVANIQNCQTPYPDPTKPDDMTEWYSYNHSLTASLQHSGAGVINSTVSCNDACTNGGCSVSNTTLYQYIANGKYYFNRQECYTNQGLPQYVAVCSGGSPLGQNCYTFNADRTLASTQQCTTTTTTTTTTEACECINNACTSTCFCGIDSFCYDVNNCTGNCI